MTTTPVTWKSIATVNDPTNEAGSQNEPRITELRDGRILITWRDSGDNYDDRSGNDIVGQLYEIDGTPIGQPFLLNTIWNGGSNTGSGGGSEHDHDIAATPDGGWFVVYEDNNGDANFIRGERFDSNGNLAGQYTIAQGSLTNDDAVYNPSIDVAANGDWVVTFARQDGNGMKTKAIVFDNNTYSTVEHDFGSRSEGTAGGPVQVSNDTAILSNGNIVTVNEDYASLSVNTRINVRVTQPDGTIVRDFLAQTSVNNWNWENVRVEALEGGGFVVTYRAVNNGADDYGIRAAVYNNAGQTVVSPFYVAFDNNNSSSTLRFSASDVTPLDDGGFLIGWVEGGSLHFQRYDGAGVTVGNELTVPAAQPGFGSNDRFESFDMTRTQDGRIMVVWDDPSQSGGDPIQFMILDVRDDGMTVTGTSQGDGLTTPNGGGTVNAGAGADNVVGRSGNDTFIDTDLTSGDHYNGRLGIDTIDYSNVTFSGATQINLALGQVTNSFSGLMDTLENIENVVGSQGGETITTISNTTYVHAQGGNDRVIVNETNMDGDFYEGGSGTDWFDISNIVFITPLDITHELTLQLFRTGGITSGGEALQGFENIDGANNIGNSVETFVGTSGANEFHGNGGRDVFRGNGGADKMYGGADNDEFVVANTHLVSGVVFDGGSGTDRMQLVNTGTYNFRPITTITNIEEFTFSSALTQLKTLQFNASQFGSGGLSNVTFNGGNGDEQLQVFMGASTVVDLSALMFSNWAHSWDEEVLITGDNSAENITGSVVDDRILGSGGNDTIDGGEGGNDELDGQGGVNTVSYASALSAVQVNLGLQGNYQNTGGGGSDLLTNFSRLTGSDYNDTLTGDNLQNILRGGAGNDTLDGMGNSSTSSEQVYGEGGNDTITRRFHSNVGMTLDGGANTDTLIAPDLTFGDLVDFAGGFIWENGVKWDTISNFENYQGSAGEDFIGNDSNNTVTFTGLNYVNNIQTGAGDDNVFAGGGADIIIGGKGLDNLRGEAGNDRFIVGIDDLTANETMNGGGDTDTVEVRGQASFDLRNINLISIENLEFAEGGDQAVIIISDSQAQELSGIDGNSVEDSFLEIYLSRQDFDASDLSFSDWVPGSDEITIWGNDADNTIIGTRYNDDIRGGNGEDTVDYSGASAAVNVTLNGAVGIGSGGEAEGDRLRDIENLIGSKYDDELEGDDESNRLIGGLGGDELRGLGGTDYLGGGAGENFLDGGADEDFALFDGVRASFAVTRMGDVVMLHEGLSGNRNWVVNVENFSFQDTLAQFDDIPSSYALDYVASNTDLIGLLGADVQSAMRHFFETGYYESRDADSWDEWSYLASYGDLLQAFGSDSITATRHFVGSGFAEGRVADSFDEWSYLASNTDVLTALGGNGQAAARHYVEQGYNAGLALDSFDEWSYLASYEDLLQAFGADGATATLHYVTAGYGEGRTMDAFDEWSYLASYGDLLQAFGADGVTATLHYVTAGYGEGRVMDAFDENLYIASNTGLIHQFQSDRSGAARHYVETGYGLGLETAAFDAQQYLDNYADLQAAFGNNLELATLHFIANGFDEGRTDDIMLV